MTIDLSPWLTTAEAADFLGISSKALHWHVSRGNIKPDSWGKRGLLRGHRFSLETLDGFRRGTKKSA